MVERQLRLELPDGFKWLQAKVVSSSPNVQAKIEQTAQSLTFDTGLFRCREFVRFECLAEVPIPDERTASIEKRFLKELDVTHRIADMQKVKPVRLPSLQWEARRNKRMLKPLIGLSMLGVVLAVALFIKGVPVRIHYQIANESGFRIEVTATAQDDGQMLIKGVTDKSFKKRIPASEFFLTPNMDPKIIPDRLEKFGLIGMAFFYVLAPLCMYFALLRGQRKTRQIRGLLGVRNEEGDGKKRDRKKEPSTPSD